MFKWRLDMPLLLCFLMITCLIMLVGPATALAGPPVAPPDQGPWWEVEPEDEKPAGQYDSILYSEIAAKLHEIQENSNRVKVEVIGQSAGGRDLFLVTLSDPQAMGRLGPYQAIRRTMLTDPERAQELIDQFGDFKVPVFINGSIHGDEYPGVDATIRLIEKLAYEDGEEVQAILENVILLVNVVANPDGRVLGTRANANGFDLNRDFIAQTQPETRALVNVFTDWNPMVVLDLHGFVNPMLIEPCTPPHNPNYEYDLYIQWAFYEALAMEAELLEQTGFKAQIPFRDDPTAWDDWSPAYTPMYGMFHGGYGHTLETPFRDERGVAAHYAAVWGALKFVVENREAMIRDQIEIFRRGFLDLPQMLIPDDILDETQYDQFNNLTIKEFPTAYVIPADAPLQVSPHQPARLIDFLLLNDVEVEQTRESFELDDVEYPSGTYVVWMDQPKRGLANTFLEDGPNLSDLDGISFYSPPSVWSHPLLWGAARVVTEGENFDIDTEQIENAGEPEGSVEDGEARAYAYLPTSIAAFKATNYVLGYGDKEPPPLERPLLRATESFTDTDSGRIFGPGTIIVENNRDLVENLAEEYALDFFALDGQLDNTVTVTMTKQSLAVFGDEGVAHALETLGYDFDQISEGDINSGAIDDYDLFLNADLTWGENLNSKGRDSLKRFLSDGGDYVGLRGAGAQLAIDAGIFGEDLNYASGNGNAIVQVNYTPDDSVAAGFPEQDYGFVYSPVWFTGWEGEAEVSARYGEGDFLVSGYWPGWNGSGAEGKPVVVHQSSGDRDVTLIGLDVTFRGHPENTFRLLGNAIYNGLD